MDSTHGPSPPVPTLHKPDELWTDLSQMPLFMQSLDDVSEQPNNALEALKALAYEGEPHEIAENFRQQGNDCYRSRNWKDAVEFYTKALDARCSMSDINEACYANRAACNLELRNYRRVNLDCAEALKINSRNTKAWYRSAKACLALDKVREAADCVQRGLAADPDNVALQALRTRITSRGETVAALQAERQERERISKAKQHALKTALEIRNIAQRMNPLTAPDLPPDATVRLQDPLDPNSTLCFPVLLLYPLRLESDFIKSLPEDATLHSQLQEILSPADPPPWDKEKEYAHNNVEILVEKKKYDIHGKAALSKIGNKTPLNKVLREGKLELINGILSVFIVPKPRLEEFIGVWKQQNPI